MKKVLFICIGNCIRSQMAEGFARTYGADVIQPFSAGVAPAGFVSEIASQVMNERGISLADQYSKEIHEVTGAPFHIAINMSGERIPARGLAVELREWTVADPMGKKPDAYERAAQEIENLVMGLILELRRPSRPAAARAARPAPRVPSRKI